MEESGRLTNAGVGVGREVVSLMNCNVPVHSRQDDRGCAFQINHKFEFSPDSDKQGARLVLKALLVMFLYSI